MKRYTLYTFPALALLLAAAACTQDDAVLLPEAELHPKSWRVKNCYNFGIETNGTERGLVHSVWILFFCCCSNANISSKPL